MEKLATVYRELNSVVLKPMFSMQGKLKERL